MTAAQIGSLEGTTIEAGSNIRANSAEQYDYTMADVKVKKSGIMGSGMGFMIGTKKSTDTQSGSYITQVGTTIGSVKGNTQIKAGDTVHLTTTNVVSDQDVIIGGQDVILDGAYNTADENYYAKRSSSGLTVSLGGVVPSVLQSASNYISQGNHRDNTLLGTLEYGEAAREIHKGLQAIKDYQSHTASALQASLVEGRALQQTGYSLMDKGLQEKSLQTIKEGVSNVVEGQGKELAASQELSWQQQHPELAKQEQAKRRDNLIHLQIGVGAHTSSQSQTLHSATYTGGTVISKEGQISITATSDDDTKGTIKAVSEAIRANTVLLQASKDISLESATHTQRIEEQSSNSGASLGVNLGTTGILGIEASVSRGRGNTVSQVVTHAPMTVEANEDISVEAGRDISLVGATLQGDRAIVKAGQNLTIQSVQDKKDYTSKTKETGLSVSIQPTGRIGSIGGAHNIGETQSQYASVTSQAGIYAGAGGLTVDVGDTTHLTGAVLHSEATPSKNVVKTGTLVMEDIHNVAEYTSKSKGFSYVYDDEYKQAKRKLQAKEPLTPGEIHTLNNLHNQVGLLPDLSVGTHKKETSVTQSAITDGQLLITDGVIDIETINRDTTQSLHRLQDIFDAKSVKEKEELARLLSKNINEGIHILSEHKHWAEGSPQKIALHALSAGLSAQVAKGDFFAGAVAGGTNEAFLPKLQQMLATDDPAVIQAASAILGYATNKTLGKEGQTGAALAQYGTKWNNMYDNDITEGEYQSLNDAYYAMYTQVEIEKERSEFNVWSDEMNILYGVPMILSSAKAASWGALNSETYGMASRLFRHSLFGQGESQYFGSGTELYNSINGSREFKDYLKETVVNLVSTGESRIFYQSYGFAEPHEKFAVGHIKYAIKVVNEGSGRYHIVGQTRDVYNFEKANTYLDGINQFSPGAYINNQAFVLQKGGVLYPFIYAVQIDLYIESENS